MNVFFTIINNGYAQFAINFFKRWRKLDIEKELLFVCTDQESFDNLNKNKANCKLYLQEDLSKNLETWMSERYKKIVFKKLFLTNEIINFYKSQYTHVTYIDTDFWINLDFTHELDKIIENNNFDILLQDGEDYLSQTDECCVLNNFKFKKIRECGNSCTGFMVIKTFGNKINELFSYSEKDINTNLGNQDFINNNLKKYNIKYYNIPKIKLPNFSTSYYFKKINDYWMLHYNYLIGKEKYYYMQKNGHWLP